jgi:hypothetical protein
MVLDVMAFQLCQSSLDCFVEPVIGRASRDLLARNDAKRGLNTWR